MAELCREFGISRKTGYKIFDRYQECGVQGLTDRSRRPYRYANQLPFQVENFVLNLKHEHPSWGARKIRERLLRRFSGRSCSRAQASEARRSFFGRPHREVSFRRRRSLALIMSLISAAGRISIVSHFIFTPGDWEMS
jgi:Homeodomain-like domain